MVFISNAPHSGIFHYVFFTCFFLNIAGNRAQNIENNLNFVGPNDFLRLNGTLLDDSGNGISGAKLQIWQTDLKGVYDHPRSIGFDRDTLDSSFQYFGTATSEGDDGNFSFLTIRPGLYPARPISHIHFKIFLSGELKLTTQMYFADENPRSPSSLVMNLDPHPDGGFETDVKIVLNMGGGGSHPLTPSQPAGPYYPVVDFFDVGSNLIVSNVSSSIVPSTHLSNEPSQFPTASSTPTEMSSKLPSLTPSIRPSSILNLSPSQTPSNTSIRPSSLSTSTLSEMPSNATSSSPTNATSSQPSKFPTPISSQLPSRTPILHPSQPPSISQAPSTSFMPSSTRTFCGGFTPASRIAQIKIILRGVSDRRYRLKD